MIVFTILVMTSVLVYLMILLALQTDLLSWLEFSISFAVTSVLFVSISIGTIISSLVGKRILSPMTRLNHASKEIAGGNFNIKLDTTSQIREITETFTNFNQMADDFFYEEKSDGIGKNRITEISDFCCRFNRSRNLKSPLN